MAEKKSQEHTIRIVTTGNTVRIETPSGKNRRKPKVSVINSADDVVEGFVSFLREHAVVALALGFVIATQIQTLAKQLISSFIDPLFTLLFGKALSTRTFTLHFHGRWADFGWGGFVYGLLNVLFVLIAIYAIVKIFKLDRLDKPVSTAKGKKEDKQEEDENEHIVIG